MRFEKTIIAFLMVSSFWLFWVASDNNISGKVVFVERVVDGDTVQLADGSKVRLLGINTPEKSQFFYQEAKDFTINLLTNKSAVLTSPGKDKYGRNLGYLFLENQNVNELIVEKGFAHLYYYGEDKYYEKIKVAEENAREKELGIWKHSKNFGCLNITSFVYLDITEKDKENLTLKNNCNNNLEVSIKDDATHIYPANISAHSYYEKITQSIWNDAGDTIYIWDEGGLVLFYRY